MNTSAKKQIIPELLAAVLWGILTLWTDRLFFRYDKARSKQIRKARNGNRQAEDSEPEIRQKTAEYSAAGEHLDIQISIAFYTGNMAFVGILPEVEMIGSLGAGS